MPRIDQQMHLRAVRDTVEQLYNICMGQGTPLCAVLPSHIRNMPLEYKVGQLVDQLVFSLTAVSNCAPDELRRAESWLAGIVFFLLTRCSEGDGTFSNIARLFRQPIDTRRYIFEESLRAYDPLRTERNTPAAFEHYDEAVLYLLISRGLGDQIQSNFVRLQSFLTEMRSQS